MSLFKTFCRYLKKEFPVWTTSKLQICDKGTCKTNEKKPDRKKIFGSIHDQYSQKSLHYGRVMNEILTSSVILNGISSSNQLSSRGRHFWNELCKKALPKSGPTEQSILLNKNYRRITKDNKIIEHEEHYTASCEKTKEFSSFEDEESFEYATKKVNEPNYLSEYALHNESSESECWFRKFCKPPGNSRETDSQVRENSRKKLQLASISTATKPTEVRQTIGNHKTWATKYINTTKVGMDTPDLEEGINSKTLIENSSHKSDQHNSNSVSKIFVNNNGTSQDSAEDAQQGKICDVDKRLEELQTKNIDTTKMGMDTPDLEEDINSKTLIENSIHKSDQHNSNSFSKIFVNNNGISQDSGEDAQQGKICDVDKRPEELEMRQTRNNHNISNAQDIRSSNVIPNSHADLQENVLHLEDSQHQYEGKSVIRASKNEKSLVDEGVREIPGIDSNVKGEKQNSLEMDRVKDNKTGHSDEKSTVKKDEELEAIKVEHGNLNETMLLNNKRRSMVQSFDVTQENNTYCNLIRLQETDEKILHSQRQDICQSVCEDGGQDIIKKPTSLLREHSVNKNKSEVTTDKIGFGEIAVQVKNTEEHSERMNIDKNKMLLDENKKMYNLPREVSLSVRENLQNAKAQVQTVQSQKATLPQGNKGKYEDRDPVEHQRETESIYLNRKLDTEKEESKTKDNASLAGPKISIGTPSLDVCDSSKSPSIREKYSHVPREDDSACFCENETETVHCDLEDGTRKLQDDIQDSTQFTPGLIIQNKIDLADLIESPKKFSMEQKAERCHLRRVLNSKDSRAILKTLSRLSGCLHKLSANIPKTDRKVSHVRQIASSCTPEQTKENLCQESNCQCIYCVFGVECKIYPTTCKKRDFCGELDSKQDLLCKMCHIFNTRGANQLNRYFKNDYKNKEYYLYTDASYYDIHQFLAEVRLSYDLMMKIKEKLGAKKI